MGHRRSTAGRSTFARLGLVFDRYVGSGIGGTARFIASTYSFLADPDTYRNCLTRAGLEVTSVRDRTDSVLEFVRQAQAALPGQGRPSPGPHLLMGENFSDKVANAISAMQRGVIAPTEIIAIRPSS